MMYSEELMQELEKKLAQDTVWRTSSAGEVEGSMQKYRKDIIEFVARMIKAVEIDTAYQCYLECLATECGEGECAEGIKTKYNLETN